MQKYCTNVYFQSILKMDVKKEVDEVSSVFSQHPTEVKGSSYFLLNVKILMITYYYLLLYTCNYCTGKLRGFYFTEGS